jgi:ketosteroid isomerase-like protein
MNHDPASLADRFFAAIERGDLAEVEACYHPDARIWHNFDRAEQTVAENLAVLRGLCMVLADRRYDVVRRIVTDDGFVQQHVLRGTAPGGELALEAMMYVSVDDGRIRRLEEYLDTAQLGVLRAPR